MEFVPGPFEAPENAAFRKAHCNGTVSTWVPCCGRPHDFIALLLVASLLLLVPCCQMQRRDEALREAYAAMAEHAGMSLPQALEKQGAYFR